MIDFAPLSQIEPESVSWLWHPFIPAGKLTVLDGLPNVGKSLLTIDLAARLSRGGPMPGCTETFAPQTTILLNGEDGRADTVRRRAEAAGADLDRLILVKSVAGRTPQLPADVPYLADLAAAADAAYLAIDPLMVFLPPNVPINSDQAIRQVLTPLYELGERTGLTMSMNRHVTKKELARAIYCGTGSVGLVGAARGGLLLASHPTDEELRVLAPNKWNLTEKPPALGFRIRKTDAGLPMLEWTGSVNLSADDLCRRTQKVRPRDRARDWLVLELGAGPRRANQIITAAFALGIPERTLERAKKDLRVESHCHATGSGGEWYWFLPDLPWPKDAPFQKPDPYEEICREVYGLPSLLRKR
jgi:hypothetical protein